jgi:hypothetical protein
LEILIFLMKTVHKEIWKLILKFQDKKEMKWKFDARNKVDNILKDGSIYWICSNKKCKGQLNMDCQMTVIISVSIEDNYHNNERKIEKQRLSVQTESMWRLDCKTWPISDQY